MKNLFEIIILIIIVISLLSAFGFVAIHLYTDNKKAEIMALYCLKIGIGITATILIFNILTNGYVVLEAIFS